MRMISVFTGLAVAMLLWSAEARAADYALILSNRSYDNAAAEPDAASYDAWADMLGDAGFEVFGGQDSKTSTMLRAMGEFRDALDTGHSGRIIVVVSGRMASNATDSWLLGREYRDLSNLNVGVQGLSLGALNALLGEFQGHGLMIVAPSWSSREAAGPGLQAGAVKLSPAQGVALISGDAEKIRSFMARDFLPSGVLGYVADKLPRGVTLKGFAPRDIPLGGGAGASLDESDAAYWSAARDMDMVAAYRAYLKRFPDGLFAAEARRLIAAEEEPDRPRNRAAEEEDALGLTRDERRRIQGDLTLLGFNTYGVDGIFGARSRSAISSYQASRNYPRTSYLTAAQVARIHREANARRAEIRREDEAYWRRTGALGTERGYRDYLERYPDGIYAETARARLAEIDRPYREEIAWDRARREDTIEAYRDFLREYPLSRHAREAGDRIAELEREEADRDQIEKDKAEEAAVAGNPVSRMLIERSLDNGGFNPGKVDGIFDSRTRNAIRRFQRANGLPVTGYVSQATMLRLTMGILR